MMRRMLGVCALLACLSCAEAAQARVQISIDLSSQTMHVRANGEDYLWPVSTARSGYATPRGRYRVGHLERMHYSHKYHMSPMPYSIFFAGGYAIHGTYSTAYLGRPASHGCIRLSPANAAFLYDMVKGQGADIRITGSPRRAIHAKALWRREARRQRLHDRPGGYPDENYEGWPRELPEALAYAPARRSIYSRTRRIFDPALQTESWRSESWRWPQ